MNKCTTHTSCHKNVKQFQSNIFVVTIIKMSINYYYHPNHQLKKTLVVLILCGLQPSTLWVFLI